MARFWVTALAASVAIPGLAYGWELDLGLGARVSYDSNVARLTDIEIERQPGSPGDFLWSISPTFGLSGEGRRWQIGADYRPRYEAFVDPRVRARDSSWSHVAVADASYLLNSRTRLFADNAFRFTDSGRVPGAVDETPTGFEVVATQQTSNFLTAGVQRTFDSRMSGSLSANLGFRFFDNEDIRGDLLEVPGTSDNSTFGITGALNYALNSRNTIGGSVIARLTHFDGRDDYAELGLDNSTRAQTLQLQGSYTYAHDESLSMTFAGGPVTIFQQQNPVSDQATFFCFDPDTQQTYIPLTLREGSARCLPGDVMTNVRIPYDAECVDQGETSKCQFARQDSERVTFFGRVSITKDWKRFSGTFLYNRDQSTAGGNASLRSVDSIVARLTWQANRDWTLSGRVEYSLRDILTEDANASARQGKEELFRAGGSASRRLTKRGTLWLDAGWRRQNSDIPINSGNVLSRQQRTYDIFEAGIGVKFDLDPIRF